MTDTRGELELDVVDLLIRQHSEIRDLFVDVEAAEGEAKQQVFDRLRVLLAVHETAEEELVHPFARQQIPGGEGVVEDRLAEERRAKEILKQLDEMGAGDAQFNDLLEQLRGAVLKHARSEERFEFMKLREQAEPDRLRSMTVAFKAAEAVAPTRPHPGTESAVANLAVGPLAAVVDRVRDAIRGRT
jgi:hemerythrin superfamily protein